MQTSRSHPRKTTWIRLSKNNLDPTLEKQPGSDFRKTPWIRHSKNNLDLTLENQPGSDFRKTTWIRLEKQPGLAKHNLDPTLVHSVCSLLLIIS